MISFQEIAAYSAMTGVELDPWEAETLRQMSGAYLSEYDAASEESRPAPFAEKKAKTRSQVDAAMLGMFKALAEQDASRGMGPTPDPEEAPAAHPRSIRGSGARGSRSRR